MDKKRPAVLFEHLMIEFCHEEAASAILTFLESRGADTPIKIWLALVDYADEVNKLRISIGEVCDELHKFDEKDDSFYVIKTEL